MYSNDRLPSLLADAVEFAGSRLRRDDKPFLPFIVAYGPAGKEMIALDEGGEPEIQAQGLSMILERKPEYAVLCYHGYLEAANSRTAAIYAIGCEKGPAKAEIFCRPYRPKGFLRPMWFGPLTRCGAVNNPLRRT
jgi:hypothetical protein